MFEIITTNISIGTDGNSDLTTYFSQNDCPLILSLYKKVKGIGTISSVICQALRTLEVALNLREFPLSNYTTNLQVYR